MTSSAAVVTPLETGSKLEEWFESRAKELTQADIRLRLAVAGLAAMRREGWLTRSQKAKRRGSKRLGRRRQGR